MSAPADAAERPPGALPAVCFDRPFTLEAHLAFETAEPESGVWTLALKEGDGQARTAVGLHWVHEKLGWLSTWRLLLVSESGLLPPELVDDVKGTTGHIELGRYAPRTGNTYLALISWNPGAGILSVRLENVTEGEVLYAGYLPFGPFVGGVQAYAGWSGEPAENGGAPPIRVELIAIRDGAEPYGLPVAMQRGFSSSLLDVAADGTVLRRKVGSEYFTTQPVGLRLEWPKIEVAGDVAVRLEGTQGTQTLATVGWSAEPQDLVLPIDDRFLGDQTLLLEYVDAGRAVELARHPVRIREGAVRVEYRILGKDYDRETLHGRMIVSPAGGRAEGLRLEVEGAYRKPQAPRGDVYTRFPVLQTGIPVLDQPLVLPFEIAAPASGEQAVLQLKATIDRQYVVLTGAETEIPVTGIPKDLDVDGLFPFVVNPWREAAGSVTDVSHWLPKPAGKDGFITVRDGQFIAGDGTPIRFLGVNCNNAGCFPEHADAERIAKQMARFGINLVRIHHYEGEVAPYGIWESGSMPRRFDSVQLDRLDYFIYQLKENGIYVNFNLHVARSLRPEEGFPDPDRRPPYDKGLNFYHPDVMAYHKQFIRDLLTHVNPYTGNRYVDEPAVAMIEITNENGLMLYSFNGAIDRLPDTYLEPLDALWNAWLKERYGTTEKLLEAWRGGIEDPDEGQELALNGFLDRGTENWSLETGSSGRATLEALDLEGPVVDRGAGPERVAALRVEVLQKGEQPWLPQFYHRGIELQAGRSYRLRVWLKADRRRTVSARVTLSHAPWTIIWEERLTLSDDWQQVERVFRVPEDLEVQSARFGLSYLDEGGVYSVSALSLREITAGEGLLPGDGLETGVRRPDHRYVHARSEQVRQDYADFLWDIEREFCREMYRFLKDELGVKAPITGSQVHYSTPAIQNELDYIDAHSYWTHPSFPGASWDPANWYIHNESMIARTDGGTIPGLAQRQIEGKPFVVSEYNHVNPNTYGSEGFLIIGAYGAFQDWDGIIAFDWSHTQDFWPQAVKSWFNLKAHPTKLAAMPAAAALFLRGDVAPAKETIAVPLSETEQRHLSAVRKVSEISARDGGVDPRLGLLHRIAMVMQEGTPSPWPLPAVPQPGSVVTTDTGEITWELTGPGRGALLIDTPLSKAAVGYVGGRTLSLSGMELTVGPTRQDGWAAVTLTVMEGDGFDGPARLLLTATGYWQNNGMELRSQGGTRVTLGTEWGEEPTLVEGIPAWIRLPVPAGHVEVYALDGAGARRERVPVEGGAFRIGPEYRTLWYEVVIERQPDV